MRWDVNQTIDGVTENRRGTCFRRRKCSAVLDTAEKSSHMNTELTIDSDKVKEISME
jgi:hypothetical protein